MATKHIFETEEVKSFVAKMSKASQRKYDVALQTLRAEGRLRYPLGEKVSGYSNLFAIRIVTSDNERMFYCYALEDLVIILHAYQKKTQKIPISEVHKALAVRDELLGGAS